MSGLYSDGLLDGGSALRLLVVMAEVSWSSLAGLKPDGGGDMYGGDIP
jgi:hypothetical protein